MEFHESGKMIGLIELLHVLSEVAIVALGSVLVYVSMRAFRRTKSRSMLVLSLGFAVIIMEPLIEEIFLNVLELPMDQAHVLRNWIVAVGLLFILYSIYKVRD